MINKERNVFAFSKTRHFSGFLAAPTLNQQDELILYHRGTTGSTDLKHVLEQNIRSLKVGDFFLVHFSNVFGIDFYWIQWSTTLHSKNVYVTIDFTPCRVPPKKNQGSSINCLWSLRMSRNSRISRYRRISRVVREKHHLPLQPAKSQANWTSVGGKMEKPQNGPQAICIHLPWFFQANIHLLDDLHFTVFYACLFCLCIRKILSCWR